MKKVFSCFLVCKELPSDGVGVAIGHRISGDAAGCWFQPRRFQQRTFEGVPQNDSFIGATH